MELSELIEQIKKLSVAERILLAENIWDSIAAEQDSVPVTEAQKEELDRRLAAMEASPDEGVPWEVLKEKLLGGR
jgi:putative addiction module component (TIGR02574 family)